MKVDFGSRAQRDAEVAEQARRAAEKAARAGPNLDAEMCADCGAFGPWGDGQFFYCETHVPDSLRYAAATFRASQQK